MQVLWLSSLTIADGIPGTTCSPVYSQGLSFIGSSSFELDIRHPSHKVHGKRELARSTCAKSQTVPLDYNTFIEDKI